MHPSIHARTNPDKPACIMAETGAVTTFRDLDERSNRGAQFFRALGLQAGDTIAVFLDNTPRYFDIAWAAQRAGLFFTCISSKLTAPEVDYIVRDSGARLLIAAAALGPVLAEVAALLPDRALYALGAAPAPFMDYDAAVQAFPATPIADETAGSDMLYSSGTTGRPKGIKVPLSGQPIDAETPISLLVSRVFGLGAETVYLSPAPLYHAAPLRWCMTIQKLGGTVVVMEKFDAETCLALIEKYRVNAAQFVPTHFVRMLKLPQAARQAHDLSSLKFAVHAAAPCPVPVKRQMLDWWGPIVFEYYAGTEGNGMCMISPGDWLAHQGSVGRAVLGALRICDEAGEPLPLGQEGLVYFEGGPGFVYHNDPEKTAESRNARGWTAIGDVGRMDEDGYLYLTDRKSFMIISGGVNIYPQEIENLLITHPRVADVAVVGAPDEEMGERVVAVVQTADPAEAGPALAAELIAFARANLSHVKAPRQVDFMAELPRHPTGKLYKRLIRDAYWGKTDSRIV
ncbi:acyl-CoA synthetase [Zavarzinia compransoris]|uniref:Acyl-CoA synthetase n=1 Tax=Zavarzinia compransoris TaxID=1264899 RepID=A0A317E5Y1_9PROT|nr:acyl-CoA synthetase [Zavarzinia compransoris]PWR22022.1 acyl-CoA synthetase [Zavarzinia compransoris]TDP47237.1 long-chain acyl-CoA synthetase [Zavarzinia compransoris]